MICRFLPKPGIRSANIANFFNNKDWDRDGEVEKDSGIALHFQVRNQGMYHFVSLSAAIPFFTQRRLTIAIMCTGLIGKI